jgi:hypothetical protein
MLSMLGEEVVVVVAMVGKVLALEARRPLLPPASPPTRSWSTGRVCGTGVEWQVVTRSKTQAGEAKRKAMSVRQSLVGWAEGSQQAAPGFEAASPVAR